MPAISNDSEFVYFDICLKSGIFGFGCFYVCDGANETWISSFLKVSWSDDDLWSGTVCFSLANVSEIEICFGNENDTCVVNVDVVEVIK